MRTKDSKYDRYFEKVKKVLLSCETPEQLEVAMNMMHQFIVYYPSLRGDEMLSHLYRKLDGMVLNKKLNGNKK